ncbi:MAG: HDOD domain-containing protein [Chloroflexi bacterium]|nr:HDOD domain-containing protein [Chloroflexota bacterium]
MISNKVDQILESVSQLHPMPTSVTRVLKAFDDPLANGSYIAELIGLDQALSAAVLQMANSVSLGYNLNCSSLKEAVMRLGFKRIKTLILGAGSSGPLTRRLYGYRLGAGELWNHSVATAVAAQWLAQAFSFPNPEVAYVGGLLHDMGKLLLDQFVMVDYARIVEIIDQRNQPPWEVEDQVLGIHHAAVGGLMAEKWDFPVILVDAINYHHAPSLARTHPELPAVINIANSFTTQNDGTIHSLFDRTVHPEALQILKLSPERLEKMREEINHYLTYTRSS